MKNGQKLAKIGVRENYNAYNEAHHHDVYNRPLIEHNNVPFTFLSSPEGVSHDARRAFLDPTPAQKSADPN